jgi:signal transduction histidine kinase
LHDGGVKPHHGDSDVPTDRAVGVASPTELRDMTGMYRADGARERARTALARAREAQGRARAALDRAAGEDDLLRQIAGALLAATMAPDVAAVIAQSGLVAGTPRARIGTVDPATATVTVELQLGAPDAIPPPGTAPAEATERVALATAAPDAAGNLREALEAVVRQMPVGVLIAEAPGGAVVLVNEQACRMLGDDIRGWRAREEYGEQLRTPGGRPVAASEWPLARAIDTGRATIDRPLLARRPGADDRHLVVSATPITEPHGTVVAAVQTMVDVTARDESARAREAIMGVLSHELRTPVTTLLGGGELLRDRWASLEPREREELLDSLVSEAERLSALIDNMLVLERVDAGVVAVDHDPVLLQQTVARALTRERRRFPATSFSMPEVLAGAHPAVVADDAAVEQVLMNLLANAAKHGGVGGHVQVRVDRAGAELTVRVLDDGPGLRGTAGGDLFRLQLRGPGIADRNGGAGIGLYVASRLVTAMAGRMWARDREEGGAEFGFSLPVHKE